MRAQLDLQFQLHEFGKAHATANKFTFIPYGLDTGLSREAVKVHVLHGRKRKSATIRSNASQVQRQNHGRNFEWDSKAESKQQSKKGGCTTTDLRDVALVAGVPCVRHDPHTTTPRKFMWDSQVLHNPFVEHLREDTGIRSSSWIHSTNYLVDHYLNRCGSSHFPRELLACYWQDSAFFKAFLAHAATLFTLETGQSPPIAAEELMYSALREVRRRLSDPVKKHADGTILAVTMLANAEEGRSQHETAEHHWCGLKQLLRLRGSFSSLRRHRDLHTMLLWREIITSNSYHFCFGHGIDDAPELQQCNEHLIAVFNTFADQLEDESHLDHIDNDVRQFMGTIVNRNIITHCDWTSSMKRRSEIACLLYLAMLTITARASTESRRMMERIRYEVIERDRWGPVSQEELLFIMLYNGNLEHEWRCQQLWQISRCIFMTRKLEIRDWKTVRDILSLFVGIKDGCDSKEEVLGSWGNLYKRLLREDGCRVELGEVHVTGWEGIPKVETE